MLVGVWVMFFLFLGLPQYLHKILAVITGVGLIFLGYKSEFETPTNTNSGDVPYEEHKSEVISSPSETAQPQIDTEAKLVADVSNTQSNITNPNQPLN